MGERRPPPPVSALRARYEQRVERLTALRHVRSELVSLAGLIGKPVLNQAGQQIGQVSDVVARWDTSQPYPPATGLIVRVGRRRAWLPVDAVEEARHSWMVERVGKYGASANADSERQRGGLVSELASESVSTVRPRMRTPSASEVAS